MNLIGSIISFLDSRKIKFKEKRKEAEGVYSFVFEFQKPLIWGAGRHAMFILNNKGIKENKRIFSVSSCALEKEIRFTTRASEDGSEYKKALLNLKKGESIIMRGPLGNFTLDKTRNNILIAGGIGITPFRAMLEDARLDKYDYSGRIRLLYISQDGYLFKDDLEEVAKDERIDIEYFDDRGSIQDRVIEISKEDPEAFYYIAGPKSLTFYMETLLKEKGINVNHIITDMFRGY